MADVSKYGTKPVRLQECLAHSQLSTLNSQQGAEHFLCALPSIRTSEEAERIGQHLTAPEYVLLEGARLAIKRMFDALGFDLRTQDEAKRAGRHELRSDFAVQLQMIGEAQEVAPNLTLSAVATVRSRGLLKFNAVGYV